MVPSTVPSSLIRLRSHCWSDCVSHNTAAFKLDYMKLRALAEKLRNFYFPLYFILQSLLCFFTLPVRCAKQDFTELTMTTISFITVILHPQPALLPPYPQ